MSKFIADLHIHSKFSRVVSRDMVLEVIDEWAKKKGLQIGTGDFTHPGWFNEIKTKLEPAKEGLFKLKSQISNLLLRKSDSSKEVGLPNTNRKYSRLKQVFLPTRK